jgi:DNA-binding transcriptional ArsR family regulator
MLRSTLLDSLRSVSLHLGTQYLLGQEAEYLAEGGLVDENEKGRLERSELDIRRSITTLVQPQMGVALGFMSQSCKI